MFHSFYRDCGSLVGIGKAEKSALPLLRKVCLFAFCSYRTSAMGERRFPAPWTVQQVAGGYVVNDSTGRTIAWVYAAEGSRLSAMPYALTFDEARRIALGIAKLPELLGSTPK
jgi:hypothetical protein